MRMASPLYDMKIIINLSQKTKSKINHFLSPFTANILEEVRDCNP